MPRSPLLNLRSSEDDMEKFASGCKLTDKERGQERTLTAVFNELDQFIDRRTARRNRRAGLRQGYVSRGTAATKHATARMLGERDDN